MYLSSEELACHDAYSALSHDQRIKLEGNWRETIPPAERAVYALCRGIIYAARYPMYTTVRRYKLGSPLQLMVGCAIWLTFLLTSREYPAGYGWRDRAATRLVAFWWGYGPRRKATRTVLSLLITKLAVKFNPGVPFNGKHT